MPNISSLSRWLRGGVDLYVLRQMGLLSEAFATQLTVEWLFARVGPDVDVDAVLVLESLVANVAKVQQPSLARGFLSWLPLRVFALLGFGGVLRRVQLGHRRGQLGEGLIEAGELLHGRAVVIGVHGARAADAGELRRPGHAIQLLSLEGRRQGRERRHVGHEREGLVVRALAELRVGAHGSLHRPPQRPLQDGGDVVALRDGVEVGLQAGVGAAVEAVGVVQWTPSRPTSN